MSQTSLQSMTGFGVAEAQFDLGDLRIEIRSLNHRFMDIKMRVPRELSSLEPKLRKQIQSKFSRGSVDLRIQYTLNSESKDNHVLNKELAKRHFDSMKALKSELSIEEPIQFKDVLSAPEVWSRPQFFNENESSEDLWKKVSPILEKALLDLEASRNSEGNKLQTILSTQLQALRDKLSFFQKRRLECQDNYKAKIKEKIEKVFEAYPVDQNQETLLESRLSQELALLLDRTDIEEELKRLEGHLVRFTEILENKKDKPGKKLEFLLQEIHREINTLGNKAQDYSMSDEVVQSKVVVEQLREQVMNVV